MRLRTVLCALFVALSPMLPAWADEVDDLESTIKKKKYGDYWDRLNALSKLGSVGGAKAALAVGEVLDDDEAPIREAAALALARMKDDPAVQCIISKLLAHPKPRGRETAILGLGLGRCSAAVKPLEHLLAKGDPESRMAAARSLGMIGDKAAADALGAQAGGSGPPALRAQCLLALAELGAGADAIAKCLKDSNAEVRSAALAAAAATDGKAFADAVTAALADKDASVRVAAVDALHACLAEGAFDPAVKALADKEWPVRVAAIDAIVEVWTKAAVGALIAHMPEEKGRLRFDVSQALTRMTGKDIGYDSLAWKGWWESNKDAFEMEKKPKKREARQAKEGGSVTAFFNIPILSDRIAFVLDFSGSMKTMEDKKPGEGESAPQSGDEVMKMDIAIQELERCLSKLDPKVKFNIFIMCYAHDPVLLTRPAFNKTLAPASPGNLKNASKFVDDTRKTVLAVQRGRGDFWDQLIAAFQDEEVDTVIVLSDGKPTYGQWCDRDNIHYFIHRANRCRKIMIHTVLTGTKGIDAKFMDKLAGDTGGMFSRKEGEKDKK